MTDRAKRKTALVIEHQHTPTPWKIRTDLGFFIQGSPLPGEIWGEGVTNVGGLCQPKTRGKANAEFIVRAVNSHDALVGALIAVRARFQGLRLGPDESAVLDRVNAAIVAATDGLITSRMEPQDTEAVVPGERYKAGRV